MKIDNQLVPLAYDISKKVFAGEIKLSEGKKIIVGENRMNPNSAADYINNFRYLIQGRRFTRTLNYFSMDYFLENIYKDFGRTGLINSVSALNKHIEYYEHQQNTTMRKMRQLASKYDLIEISPEDKDLQEEIIESLDKDNANNLSLIRDLKAYKPTDSPQQRLTKFQVRQRDNSIIAKLKKIRGFKCQICNKKIQKADGSFYIEAAHIKPKRELGSEAPNNILILCPNHHKEFDYGNLVIASHTKDKIVFSLNGKEYQVSLKLE